MAKYIDAEKLINTINTLAYPVRHDYGFTSVEAGMTVVGVKQVVDEMPAADVAPRWIPFTKRELTAEEQEEHPEWCYIMECPLPDDGQEILVSDGKWVWQDAFLTDDGCYLDSDRELEGCAWMPLPEPYREVEE